ncbi:MAG: hypothetical protein U0V70_03005 [Terriglobia bacterium]
MSGSKAITVPDTGYTILKLVALEAVWTLFVSVPSGTIPTASPQLGIFDCTGNHARWGDGYDSAHLDAASS